MDFLFILVILFGFLLTVALLLFSMVEVWTVIIAHLAGAPFVPSRREKAERALALAGVEPNELVVDLGSGDGRVLIEAARRGAYAVGIEINPFLVWYSRWKIQRAGFKRKASVQWGDFRAYPLPQADVVFLYLWPKTVAKLKEKLERELKPDARIVSHAFPLPGWTPDEVADSIFLYRIGPKG